ncbi:MAG: phosphatidylglycerophosphatase A [Rhodospirillaceae bacterium]|nr:phosphatidylglycerophosphatase A [Rhodospirillaceae bacterium]
MDSDSQKTLRPRPRLNSLGVIAATWFGAGYLPKAPGTWGSLAALPFAWVLQALGGNLALIIAIIFVFALGLWGSSEFMKKTGSHDPGAIVIDEVCGQWIVLLAAIGPNGPDPLLYAFGFFLFRFFDVLKPWPISLADKKITGAMGVMVDDVLAGIAGLAVMSMTLGLFANG